MNPAIRSVLLWVFSLLFTLSFGIYQRRTGPTVPVRGNIEIGGEKIRFRLIRTFSGTQDARVGIVVHDTSVSGEIMFRRFRSFDKWTTHVMIRSGDTLIAQIPGQPPAGKVMYHITLLQHSNRYLLNPEPIIIRFKGKVPPVVLVPHIIFIFLAMLFSTRAGLEVIFRGRATYIHAWLTVVCLAVGGMILGPVIQKYAFGAFWTGWPVGNDLTDNKSLLAFIMWVVALTVLVKNRSNRIWPLIASILVFLVFMIPHSYHGSELDHTRQKTESVK